MTLTPIDEVLRGMDDLVRQGKVNYVAISDTPAWVIAKGNTMAELMGWSQLVALQVEYSLIIGPYARTANWIPLYGQTFRYDGNALGAARRRRAHRQIPARRAGPHQTRKQAPR